MTNTIQMCPKTYAIDKPLQMAKMATILKQHIIKNNLYVPIVGKNYVLVEGWQFAGGMMGLFPKIVKVEKLDNMKWLAQAEIINTKTKEVVGSGYALCSKAESKKSTFDEYAILSMAQTRAIGKAYRNLIGWVIKMAGYESTPAEEMKGKKEATNNAKSGIKMMASEMDKKRIVDITKELGAKTAQAIAKMVENVVKRQVDWDKMTKNEATTIYAELLQIKLAKK